jgi:hypothetical protein
MVDQMNQKKKKKKVNKMKIKVNVYHNIKQGDKMLILYSKNSI